ncbi:MAG: hypothetical protein ACRERE_28140, partial [Candidatus Entotheonellia bacterium]
MTRDALPRLVAESIDQFTGRTWLLQPLLDWFERSSERLFILTGKPGTGKSALIAWLGGAGPLPANADVRSQIECLRAQVKAVHFCQANSGNTAPKALAQNLAEQLTQTVPGFGDAL